MHSVHDQDDLAEQAEDLRLVRGGCLFSGDSAAGMF